MAISAFSKPEFLNEWQRIMEADGAPRWWFNQVTGTDAPLLSGSRVYIQFERDIIAQNLNSAVSNLETYLKSPIMPTYCTETWLPDVHGNWNHIRLPYGNILGFGTRATTLLDDDASITYSRVYEPTINDTATITITDTDTNPNEVQIFFRVADGADSNASETYRIYPARVVRTNATTLTITAHRSLFAKPTLWALQYSNVATQERNQLDTTDVNDFVTMVDVYRVYTDTDNQGTVSCPTLDSNNQLSSTTTDATFRIVDSGDGVIQGYSNTWNWVDRVDINYIAGFPLINQRIDFRLAVAMARLANTYFPEQLSPIYDIEFGRYAMDRQVTPREELQSGDVNNPFGLLRGQVHAWRQTKMLGLGVQVHAI